MKDKYAIIIVLAFAIVCISLLGFSTRESSKLDEMVNRIDHISANLDTLNITATDLYHAQILEKMSRWEIKNFVTDSVGIDTFVFVTPEDIIIANGRRFNQHVSSMIFLIQPDNVPPGLDQFVFVSFASNPNEEVCIVEGQTLILSSAFQDTIFFRAGINRDVTLTVLFKKVIELR